MVRVVSQHVLDESRSVPLIAKFSSNLRPAEEIFSHSVNHHEHYPIVVKICWLKRCIIVLNV